jgi:hypothetical protein
LKPKPGDILGQSTDAMLSLVLLVEFNPSIDVFRLNKYGKGNSLLMVISIGCEVG